MNNRLLLLFLLVFISSIISLEIVSADDKIVIKQATLPNAKSLLACAEDTSSHKIYCFGGDSPITDQIIEYDSLKDQVTIKQAKLPSARWGMACAENSATHKIYCFGGYTASGNQIIEYTSTTDQIVVKQAKLPFSTRMMSCAEDSTTHKIYCFGGDGEPVRTEVLEYDSLNDKLVVKQAQKSLSHHACVEGKSTRRIYCFAGEPEATANQIVEYDPILDIFQTKQATFPTNRYGLACSKNSPSASMIYCFGGNRRSVGRTGQIIKYDYINDILTVQKAVLPSAREFLSCAPNTDTSLIYCFGGTTSLGVLNQIIEYSGDLPLTINPPLLQTPPRIGSNLDITLHDTNHPGAPYFLLMSFSDTPGTKLSDNRIIPLTYDGLFHTSLFGPLHIGLFESQSRFDATGKGTSFWKIPDIPLLAGQTIYFGFLTLDLRKPIPQGILSISRSAKIKILPNHFTPDANTLALWNFNEGTGTTLKDLSGNGNDGDIKGGATWVEGIEGKALQFDGTDDYVLVKDHASLNNYDKTFTLEAMVYVEGKLSDTKVDQVLSKDYQYSFGVGDTLFTGNLAYSVADQPSTICDAATGWCDGKGPVKQGEWHHIAVQYDGKTLQTFIDTQLVQSYPAVFTPGKDDKPLSIGAHYTFVPSAGGAVGFFQGKIDEVRISNIPRY